MKPLPGFFDGSHPFYSMRLTFPAPRRGESEFSGEKLHKAAVKDCVDVYGDFIGALARKFTGSTEEAAAEAAAQEIFIDIWQYAERGDKAQPADNTLISLIALRLLIKYLNTI